jgi:hypothetical protein
MPLRGLTRRNAPDDEYAVWLAWSHASAICYVAGTFSLDLSRAQTPANYWERLEGL